MPVKSENREDVIDLSLYWSIIMIRKWKIIVFVGATTLLAALFSLSMERVYRASTTVLIESDQAKIVSIEDVYGVNTTGKEYFLTQFEILKSRQLPERVVKRLELTKHPLFDPRQEDESFSLTGLLTDSKKVATTDEEVFQIVVSRFHEGLSVSPVRNTQLAKIIFESSDPKLAALVTNTLAEEYIDSHLEAKLQVTVQAAGWLSGRLVELRNTLQESERKLQAYRESEGLVDVKGVQTLSADELEELTQRLADASQNRSEAETLYRQVQRLGDEPAYEDLIGIPLILLHPLVQNMREEQGRADRRVAELRKRYGPKHPKMIAAESNAEQAKLQLQYQAARVANGIETDYRGAIQTERTIKAQMDGAKRRVQGVNRKEFKLSELQRDVESNRQLYDMFLTRTKETGEAGGLQSAHARVVDRAIPPRHPIKPRKSLIVMLAMAVSTLIGVMLAFLFESFNKTVRTPDDIEEKLGLPMLGFLPLEASNKSKLPFEGFSLSARGGFSEAIRTVRTALMLSSIDEPHKVTVVTSSIPGEGKSTVALNLARALGQVEKVLLIDADMRRPTMSRVIDLPRESAGLSNLVAGTASLEDVIYRMDDYEVDVLPSGVIPNNPLELISSKRFSGLLDELKEGYDRIIVDSAPAHAVSDVLVLSQAADAVVYVIKADSTSSDIVLKGLDSLRDVNAPVVGCVLNHVDIRKSNRYGSYYKGYYQNYGYASDEEFSRQKSYQVKRDGEHDYEQKKVSGADGLNR